MSPGNAYETVSSRPAEPAVAGDSVTRNDAQAENEAGSSDGRDRAADTSWTIESIRGLGITTDVETAASILGFGRTKAYEMAKSGDFPVGILRIGRRYVVPVPAILRLLGVD